MKKIPRRVTPRYLERAAELYLERFNTSTANLRRVLMQKVDRSLRFHGGDRAEAAQQVEEVVERFVQAGFLDDDRYADQKAGSLQRRGNSSRMIEQKLRAKGLSQASVERAVAGLKEEVDEPDREAAITYARRRRLGPWRISARQEHRAKDLAAMARRGFSYDLSSRVIDAPDPLSLEGGAGEE